MSEKFRFVLQVSVCLTVSILAGFVLLVAAYCIPTDKIRDNVNRSSEQITAEGGYYQWAGGYKNAQTDTYTDASLYLNAMYTGSGNVIADAMNAPRELYGEDNNEESAVRLARGDEAEVTVVNYGRYWHGSLILLKPLLFLFDLGDIRMFGMILQTALLFAAVAGFVRRNRQWALAGFFTAVIMLNPVTMAMGFCFSVEYILMLILVIAALFYHEKLTVHNRYCFFFLFGGILFAYFNELSFPVIGLGMPLVVFLLLSGEAPWVKVKKEIIYGALWTLGYTAMWMGKWILAWVFTGYNYFLEALQQAERYTSDHATWEAEDPSVIDRILKNLNVYFKWPFAVLAVILLIALAIGMLRRRKKFTRTAALEMLPYLLAAVMPIAVLILLGNGYAYVHYWFTHRLLSISAFAGVCMMLLPGRECTERNLYG